jgi:hypothetical protein
MIPTVILELSKSPRVGVPTKKKPKFPTRKKKHLTKKKVRNQATKKEINPRKGNNLQKELT